jgi:uncharacterized protein
MNQADFVEQALRNRTNAAILSRLPDCGLADAWLVAGCLFQTVWNLSSGREPGDAIADYDVFYFDDSDLSWEAEDEVIRRIATHFADLCVEVQVRNQARVHLWYKAKFGPGYPQLASSTDGIDRFLVAGTCIGFQARPTGIAVHAPFGVEEIAQGILRPNPNNLRIDAFRTKAQRLRTVS